MSETSTMSVIKEQKTGGAEKGFLEDFYGCLEVGPSDRGIITGWEKMGVK